MAGLNETPSGERVHVGFFGVRNAGKSSLVNAVCGQDLAVVSDTPGTTTDPVRKAMELLPIGPVLVIDTPGLDDAGELGAKRVSKARRVLDGVDVAVLVVDATCGLTSCDRDLASSMAERGVPLIVAWNKVDVQQGEGGALGWEGVLEELPGFRVCIGTSGVAGIGVEELKVAIAKAASISAQRPLVADLLHSGDIVVLVVPLDSAAPKGRLILPQQQVIRDVIEAGAMACVSGVEELDAFLGKLQQPPRLVVCDSQVFAQVARIVPQDVALTSFSIVMARHKGTLPAQVLAVSALESLGAEDCVLIAEGCTHHRQCEDIGTVKMPRWIGNISGVEPRFSFASGGDFPDDVSPYRAVVHCGGCMLNAREMSHRANICADQGVPFTNYGMTIALAEGLLPRALHPLGIDPCP